jgi:hypothetical protein
MFEPFDGNRREVEWTMRILMPSARLKSIGFAQPADREWARWQNESNIRTDQVFPVVWRTQD